MGLQRTYPASNQGAAGREVKAEAGARPVAWMQPGDSGRRAVAVDAPRQHRSRGRGPGGGGAIRWRAQRRGLAELEEAQLRFPLGRFETISVFSHFWRSTCCALVLFQSNACAKGNIGCTCQQRLSLHLIADALCTSRLHVRQRTTMIQAGRAGPVNFPFRMWPLVHSEPSISNTEQEYKTNDHSSREQNVRFYQRYCISSVGKRQQTS